LVLDPAVQHGRGLAAGAGDRGGAGVSFQRSRVRESGSVIADLSEYPGAGESTEACEAGDDSGVRGVCQKTVRWLRPVPRRWRRRCPLPVAAPALGRPWPPPPRGAAASTGCGRPAAGGPADSTRCGSDDHVEILITYPGHDERLRIQALLKGEGFGDVPVSLPTSSWPAASNPGTGRTGPAQKGHRGTSRWSPVGATNR
jgi:hypothetical protein